MAFDGRRLLQLNAYDRHKLLVNQYILIRKGATKNLGRDSSKDKRDIDVIRENHRFLWTDDDANQTWEEQLAKRYYDKLFKEYCICDLSRYKENKVALRWRIESEVVTGKGQFECGNKVCNSRDELRTWEVNFGYKERGEKKNALVKLRLCPPCSVKLNYHHKKREVKRNKKRRRTEEAEVDEGEKRTRVDQSEDTTAQPGQSAAVAETASTEVDESKVWRDVTANKPEEKTREDEFQEYFDDLFL